MDRHGMVDFGAGAVAGAADKIVEHPFDTVKVRVQTGYAPTVRACVRKTLTTEGPRGFYRGVCAPLSGAMVEAGISLWTYGMLQSRMRAQGADSQMLLPWYQHALAGAGTGFTSAGLLTPVELIKVRLQARASQQNARRAIRAVLLRRGLRGLFTGLPLTLLRDVPGNAALFGMYDGVVVQSYVGRGGSRLDAPAWLFPLAGSAGGTTYWMVAYPADTLKSRLQAGDRTAAGLLRLARREIHNGGVRGLYRGLSITVLRSVPANAIAFVTYETTRRRMLTTLDI
eukprot:TRINITY_DN42943_c0_g1_i1.p1 TRINITY_DN42943_c0_g1~~TRINITY_DN42943_c0_g1_i1.p1  ORF type:complete len:284 (+),score=61.61 TRINITY_DN42943_c0_g1_i1:51-902(+)